MSDYRVQSVLIDSHKNTIQEAFKFLVENGFKSSKMDVTEEFFRFRQYEPSYLKQKGFTDYRTVTIDENNNIKFIIVYRRPNQGKTEKKIMKGGMLVEPSEYI
jgi:hypothetical protein